MDDIEARRFQPNPEQVHRFTDLQVTEFKDAILAVGGRIIEDRGNPSRNPEETEYYRIIDTAARLSAILLGNSYLDPEALRKLFENPNTDIHPIDVVKGGSERKVISNLLNSVMHVVPIYLIDVDSPLNPSGLVALSTLSKLPSNPVSREDIRKRAKALLKKDPIASDVYRSNIGRFNGQFDFNPRDASIEALMGATNVMPLVRK